MLNYNTFFPAECQNVTLMLPSYLYKHTLAALVFTGTLPAVKPVVFHTINSRASVLWGPLRFFPFGGEHQNQLVFSILVLLCLNKNEILQFFFFSRKPTKAFYDSLQSCPSDFVAALFGYRHFRGSAHISPVCRLYNKMGRVRESTWSLDKY